MVARHLLPNWDRFEALLDTRCLVDSLIARTAAERRTRSDVRAITRALRAYHDAADRETSGQADERLHRTIANATHNPVLVSLSMQLRSLLTLNLGMDPYTRKIREQATHQHTELVEAIEAGDADLAAAVAREHAQLSQKRIRNLVRRVRREQAESSDTA